MVRRLQTEECHTTDPGKRITGLMTNPALVKNRAAANTGDNAKFVCGKAEEAQWHVLSTCKATITQLFDGDTQKEESDDGKA